MKLLGSMFIAGIVLLSAGCASTASGENSGGNLACLLTVEPPPDGQTADYMLSATVYREDTGDVAMMPRWLLSEASPGRLAILQNASACSFILYSKAFGPVAFAPGVGGQAMAVVTKAAGENMVDVGFLMIDQNYDGGKASMRVLDLPVLRVPLKQPVLILNRGGGVIQVDLNSPASVLEARKLSPRLPLDK